MEEITLHLMHTHQKKKYRAAWKLQSAARNTQEQGTKHAKDVDNDHIHSQIGQQKKLHPEVPTYRSFYSIAELTEMTSSLSMDAESPDGDLYFNTIETEEGKIWTEEITINEQNVLFKIDTGAEVTAVPESTWSMLKFLIPDRNPNNPSVVQTASHFRSWAKHP